MKPTVVWIIFQWKVSTLRWVTLTTSMADSVMVTVIKIVIQVTVIIMIHFAICNVFDSPDLQIFIFLLIRIIEG